MKKQNCLITLILVLIILVSCKDDKETNWKREEFNTEYSIMFPKIYDGGIEKVYTGRLFSKKRYDDKVIFSGGFCVTEAYPSCSASDYLEQSLESLPDSVTYTNMHGQLAYLNKRLMVSENNNVIGCLYFINNTGGTFRDSYGSLYLKTCNNSCFKKAGKLDYSSEFQEEINQIVLSIKQK